MTSDGTTPYLCDQYNKGGWLFRYPVLTSVAFWIHDKTCPDLKEARSIEYTENSEPITPEMTGAEFKDYTEEIDGESEYAKFLYYQRGITKGRTDIANQLLQIVEDDDHPIWSNETLQQDLTNIIRELAK